MTGEGLIRTFSASGPQMLYIHWPFCKHKCHYCDFVAFEGHQGFERSYHEALCNEIRRFAAQSDCTQPIRTIFIGGGTPSLYPLAMLEELFVLLRSVFDLSQCVEISLEVNPGGQTSEHFQTWRRVGINRLSVGVQVLDTAVLRRLNRHQTTEEVTEFFALAANYFTNLSADMIIGLPGVDAPRWHTSINTMLSWPITHASLYFLTIHEQTPLYYGVRRGSLVLPKDEEVLAQYSWTVEAFARASLQQYEISNFALPGYESLHNQGYWNRLTYRGFGLGAASYDGKYRFSNLKNLGKYSAAFSTVDSCVELPHAFLEQLSPYQKAVEALMLGLRQTRGLLLSPLRDMISPVQYDRLRAVAAELATQGYVEYVADQLRLTRNGILMENSVVVRLCQVLDDDQLG